MTRIPFVAVALCAPAAFALADLRTPAAASVRAVALEHGPVARVARVVRSRGSLPRVSASLSPVARIASLAQAEVATAKSGLANRDRAAHMARGDGPAVLTSALMQTVPGDTAKILPDGYAAAPANAPAAVQQAIWAGNQLIGLPYVYGGGHGSFISYGYDCSGSVSFALAGGGLLTAPLDSGEFTVWASQGMGSWITVYANGGHAFAQIAGIRLDTSTAGQVNGLQGPRWRPLLADTSGYVARHPAGY